MSSTSENTLKSNAELLKKVGQQEDDQRSSARSFDVPSRALLDAIRSTSDDRRHFRRISPTRRLRQLQKTATVTDQEVNMENEQQLETPIAQEENAFCKDELKVQPDDAVQTMVRKDVQFCDASSSPIRFLNCENDQICAEKTVAEEGEQLNGSKEFEMSKFGEECSSRIFGLRENTASPTASDDSLDGYSPPKLGVPGRPGTRDLDHQIRRLGLRKKVSSSFSLKIDPRFLIKLAIPLYKINLRLLISKKT